MCCRLSYCILKQNGNSRGILNMFIKSPYKSPDFVQSSLNANVKVQPGNTVILTLHELNADLFHSVVRESNFSFLLLILHLA